MDTEFAKTAAVISIMTAFSPLELIKLRLQTSHQLLSTGKINERYSSIRQCALSIFKKEGLRSFWKGNTISILRFFPNETINYKVRALLHRLFPQSVGTNVFKAIVAGWTASSLLYPVDILRQSLATSTDKQTKILATVRRIVRSHGFKYFYKGYLNSMLGTAVYRGSFNGFFDSAKKRVSSWGERTGVAYMCAVVAGTVCYPIDIVNRRRILINSNQGIIKFGRSIWKQEGILGFYKGSKLIPLQSITGALVLLMFDRAGITTLLERTE